MLIACLCIEKISIPETFCLKNIKSLTQQRSQLGSEDVHVKR